VLAEIVAQADSINDNNQGEDEGGRENRRAYSELQAEDNDQGDDYRRMAGRHVGIGEKVAPSKPPAQGAQEKLGSLGQGESDNRAS